MSTNKWAARRINLNLSEQESRLLEAYSKATDRTQTEIMKEFIRTLKIPKKLDGG